MQLQNFSMNRLLNPAIFIGALSILCQPLIAKKIDLPTFSPSFSTPTEEATTVKKRLLSKAGVIDLRYDGLVQHYIESYTVRARPRAGRILTRAQQYFPIIEKYLAEQGLPNELKYMAVIESALNPTALSDAGAVGLWQLMPATARHYGLQVNDKIDERKDVHKATQAALKYLVHLEKKLGSWTLAIAAYNCGGGKVLKAMRYSYSDDFWELRMFLPKQTQYYIHKIAAAVYVMNYHNLHDLSPKSADYFLQFTKVTKVYKELNLSNISRALDIPIEVIERLNPSYTKQYVPYNKKGNFLILPKVKMSRFITYYNLMIARDPADYI